MIKKFLRGFVKANRWLSFGTDKLLATSDLRKDGCADFVYNYVPLFIKPNQTVYDIGGGSVPHIDVETKQAKNIKVIGLDISSDEMDNAPQFAYDEKITADLTQYTGRGDGDLIICQSVLEHVPDNDKAFYALSTILKAGGEVVLFLPSRKALFSQLNILLPEGLKNAMMNMLYPHSEGHHGFKAHYNKATINEFSALAAKHGLKVKTSTAYYISDYFFNFYPAYLIWRLHKLISYAINKTNAAESFSMTLTK